MESSRLSNGRFCRVCVCVLCVCVCVWRWVKLNMGSLPRRSSNLFSVGFSNTTSSSNTVALTWIPLAGIYSISITWSKINAHVSSQSPVPRCYSLSFNRWNLTCSHYRWRVWASIAIQFFPLSLIESLLGIFKKKMGPVKRYLFFFGMLNARHVNIALERSKDKLTNRRFHR